jgi:hypothetical protein
MAAALVHTTYWAIPNFHSDFEQSWFGASALLHGANPYALVGPGRAFEWPWRLFYPPTALVAVSPLTLFSPEFASVVFVWTSTFALALGVTATSWHRLPLFASASFVYSARLAQWSILFTAALFIPALATLVIAKPQSGFAVLISSVSRQTWKWAGVGALILLTVSLGLAPTWPAQWWESVRSATDVTPPIIWLGGPLVFLALLRWRRPEAWVILGLACVPQTIGWYGALTLLAVPRTYREACVLSLVSTMGVMITDLVTSSASTFQESLRINGGLMIAFCYVPAVISVLRSPNQGESPVWLQRLDVGRSTRVLSES